MALARRLYALLNDGWGTGRAQPAQLRGAGHISALPGRGRAAMAGAVGLHHHQRRRRPGEHVWIAVVAPRIAAPGPASREELD